MSLIEQLVVDTIEEYERLAGEYSRKAEALRVEWRALNRPIDPPVIADGWIKWDGEPRSPVPNGPLVEVKFRDGSNSTDRLGADWTWGHDGGVGDIVAYRVIKEEA